MKVVGPAASDGPAFVAVRVTVPDWPGVIVGEVMVRPTLALPAAVVSGAVAELLPLAGSVAVEVDTVTLPPASVLDGVALAATTTGIDSVVDAPDASDDEMLQVTVPEASVQPAGSVPDTVTPIGGV